MRGRIAVIAAMSLAVLPATPAWADANVLCRFDTGRLAEISGLATSALHEGIVWAHNDSGGGPWLYALDTRTCEIAATLKVRGVSARDPEAIAVGTGATGAPVIWWGDIGDNTSTRRFVELHEITEPSDLIDGVVTPTTYRIRLDEPEDAEALLADGDQLWMIGKGLLGGTMWRLPAPLRPGEPVRAKAVGTEDGLVTDAAMRPGGGYAVRDYSEVRIYSGLPPGELVERMPLPEQVQGEAMTWTADGAALIVASEGDDRLLLVPVSTPVETTPPSPTPEAVSPTEAEMARQEPPVRSPGPTPFVEALEPVDRLGSLAVIALAVGAGVFAISVIAVAIVARVRSRH